MRLRVLTLLLSILVLGTINSNATHIQGGTLYWKCTPQGEYVFYGELYRDCSSLPFDYVSNLMNIVGSALPRDANNMVVDTIRLYPDSNEWHINNLGFTQPFCDSNGVSNCYVYRRFQHFYYKSNPIELNGVVPASGWSFNWSVVYGRGGLDNVIYSDVLLRAIMYSNPSNGLNNECNDNPAQFIDKELMRACLKNQYVLSSTAIDLENDSISYEWDYLLSGNPRNPYQANYDSNFSYTSPTPSSRLNSNNINSTLDANSGHISFNVFENYKTGSQSLYGIVIRADVWKGQQKVASIFNDRPLVVNNCKILGGPTLNRKPFLQLEGDTLVHDTLRVVVGELIDLKIEAKDEDSLRFLNMYSSGNQFSRNFSDSQLCSNPPCAILEDTIPKFNQLINTYLLDSRDSIITNFRWQTDTNHLVSDSCSIYQFNFYLSDGNCPIALTYTSSLTIILSPDSNSCTPLSIAQFKKNKPFDFKVFPNPTSGMINVSLNKKFSSGILKVYDIHGKLVIKDRINSNYKEIDLNQPKGIYFLEIENEKGELVQEKVVKL